MKKTILYLLCIFILASTLAACGSASTGKTPDDPAAGSTDKPAVSNTSNSGETGIASANTEFAIDIFRLLNKEDRQKNIFISPLSISTALSMVYQGAGTTTKEAMAKALKYEGMDIKALNDGYKKLLRQLKKNDKGVELNISNSVWIRDGMKVKDGFLTVNKNIFNAQVEMLDFSKDRAADTINKWISGSTKGKIGKMIDAPIPENILMYLINAIYFKGDWENKFDAKATADSDFHSGDGKTGSVRMMQRNGNVEYANLDGDKAIRLPYKGGITSMYCILPKEGTSIDSYIESMNSGKWTEIRKSISQTHDVILKLPRFKLEYGIKNLNESLEKLGMGEAFSDTADFSGIREGVSISRVLHKAVIEVNEEGSEAAAATVVEVKETAAVLEPPSFIADRPFLFLIADDETGTILFIGKINTIK